MRSSHLRSRILAHRGLWQKLEEQNSPVALLDALTEGFGIETDIRDLDGEVVIGHDPAFSGAPGFRNFLEDAFAAGVSADALVALNVKSDGLLSLECMNVLRQSTLHYFFFDMSFPQVLQYSRKREPVALRVSEFEDPPVELTERLGIKGRFWLDSFESDWWLTSQTIQDLCRRYPVTVVSPEIHGRDPKAAWEWFAAGLNAGLRLSLCTDRPFDVLEVCRS